MFGTIESLPLQFMASCKQPCCLVSDLMHFPVPYRISSICKICIFLLFEHMLISYSRSSLTVGHLYRS